MRPPRLSIALLLLGLGACSAPAPCERGSIELSEDDHRCSATWRCVDGEQRMRCDDLDEGGALCSCLVDGRAQLDDGGGPRQFVYEGTAQGVCGLAEDEQVALANEGCRWNVQLGAE